MHKDICIEIKKAPSTISFHLKKLIDAGVVSAISIGRGTAYEVPNPERIVDILITYKRTFLDDAVDTFIDTWASLDPKQTL